MAGNTRDITLLGKGQRLTPLSDIVSSPDSAPSVYSGGRIVPLSENTKLQEKTSQNSGMQSIQLGAMPKMEVTPQQYRFIMNHLAGIKDKAQAEAEEIRLASALSYSRNFGLPLDYCLRNLEEMNKAYLGTEYKATATNFRAIYNEGQIGKLTVERGRLGNLIMNTSDPAKRDELLAQVSEIDASIESMQDSLPRNWLVEMAKMTGNSLYFTASSGVAGLKGAGVGAIGVGVLQGLGTIGVSNPLTAVPVAGTIAAVSLLFQGKNTYEIESGNTYLDLLNNGVEPEIAKGMGNIGGLINAAIEAGLGGLTSSWLTKLGVPVDSFVSKLTTRMLANGHLGAFGKVLMDVGTSSIEEGLEEGFQGIATSLAEDIAYTISETSDAEPDWNVIESFASDFVGGAASSVLLGLPASAISANSDYRTVKGLDAVAMSVRSRESYDAIASSLKPDDSITDEDWKAFTDKRFEETEKRGFEEFRAEVNQKTLDTTLTDLDEDVELDTDDGKLEGEEEQTAHPVDRMKGGRLYGHETGETQHLPRRFQAHTFSYGSPVSGDTYGAITYRTDRDGNLTITNLRTREGYQNLREEMVSDFISRYPDMNIEWETNTAEEADLREKLINANPRGVSYGLNYGELADSSDVQAIKSKLSDYFSYDETMNNAMATVVFLAAARRGMTGQELFDRYIEDIRRWTPEEQMEADRGLKPGQHRTGATEFYHITDGVKAVIYAGEKANPTTFMHEMTHLLRRIDGGNSEFRTLFESLRNDESFKRFVDNNRMIHHKDLSTLFTTEEWTEADDEFFTELSEAYWTSGQAGSARLRGFFDRLKRTFRRIYDALKGTGHLNDEIVAYYDNFFGVGDKVSSVSSEANTASSESAVSQNTEQAASSDVLSGEELPVAETAGDVSAEEESVQSSASEGGMLDDWKALRFREVFRSITDNEAIITALENIPVALHKAAGLVRESTGSVTATDRYSLDPRYSNLTEEDAERMQKNAERYEAEAERYEAKRRKMEDTTKRVTYTIDGRTYGEMARISSLGTFSPSQYIAQTGADPDFTLSIDADNVHIEGFRKPDPNMLWDGIEGERRYQTQEEAEALIQGAIETAETHIPVEYSESSWIALFGESRQVETPIGTVVMGRNQFKKLLDRKRTDVVGMIKPTLERPSFIIREAHGSNNGNDSFNYIKVFNDENGHRWLFSVVISQDDGWYVISNRGIHDNQVQKLLLKETNSLAYVAADNQRTPSFVQRRELTGRPIDNLSSGAGDVNQELFQTVENYNPQKVGHGYKLFEQDTRTGKLYPLFIGAKEETPVGTWMVAQNIPTKGFANRPGWHIGSSLPDAPWLKGYSADNPRGVFNSKRGKNFRRVWAEVSYPMDVDYQEELDRRGIKDIKDHTPENGYYTFREANGTWIIAGALRVDRILSEEERQHIFDEAGYDEQAAWESSKDYAHRRRQYEERIAREENRQLFQTASDITSTEEWREADIRLRDNEANFDIAGRPLAPNGKLSNLPYRDWVTVRTPSFMAWFGDWMNNPEEASKIVDENGEPMAMYHGSLESFSEFSRDFAGRSADTAGVGFWFSDREDFARSFASAEWQGEGTPQVYSVFLNIRNPRVYSSTPGLTYAQYKALTSEIERLSRLISRYEASTDRAISERELNQLREERDRIISSLEGSTDLDAYESFKSDMLMVSGMSAKDVKDSGFSFDGEDNASAINERYISAMRTQGYDGIIIRDTKFDSDLIGESFNTQYVAFDPNQIKSVNNRGTFSSESNNILYQLSPEYVRENMDYETKMPTDDAFLDAVRNTPGARIEDDGIIIDLERWQRPEQDNEASVRTGVFYLPRGASQSRYYRGGTGFYGGSAHFTGETLLKAPLAVKGATGGNVPLKAYEALFGKEAAKKLEEDCESIMRPYQRSAKANRAMDVYYEYLPYADDDYMDFSTLEINSREGNQLRYAIQENIIAHAVREAGYDSVVGFNRGKLTEIFDVREGNYPSETSDTPWAAYTPEAQTLYQTQAEEFSERLNGLMESVSPIIADQELHDVFEGDRISLKKLRAATRDIRGTYTNRETGKTINFGRTALGELTRHDFRNREQAESIFHVPEFIENGRYAGTVNDSEGRIFDYYVSRFVYDGNDYLVWSSIITDRGDTYYDHKLISWKEIKDYLASGFEITSLGLDGSSPSTLKNTRLLSFLQGKEPAPSVNRREAGKASSNTLFQTMTEEEQDAFVDAALDYALTNPERLYQVMDSDISDAVRDYMAELMATASEYTDYDEYYDAATWVIPQDEELMGAAREELDKYIYDAWNRKKNPEAAGTDADAPAPTLMNPDMSASTEEMKDEEFIQIISTDEGFDEWLNTIRRAVESNSDEGERAVANAVDQDGLVAPLLVNLIHPSHSAAVWGSFKGSKYRRIETDSAKAVASAKGILKANPSYYRDLYAKATGSDFWSSIYNDAVPAELQEISADDLRTLSVSERKRLAEDIRDENMKKAILSGTDPYQSEALESLISKQERKIEDAQADIRRLEAEKKAISRRASELLGDKQQLWRETTKLQDEIDKARTRLQAISERIAKASQRDFGENGKVSQRLIDEQASIARQVTELVRQQDSYLRQLKNAEAEQRVYDARTEERWKAANRERQLEKRHKEEMADRYRRDLDRMSEIRAERDRKLQELKAYYRERDTLRKIKEHKQKLANIIKREPSKGVNWEQAEKIRAIQAFLDPNFRTNMMIDGKPYDINLLKAMFRGDVERDPIIFDSLSDAQLDRLSKKSLDEMTISELEDMATAVSQLREEGIKERKLIDSAQRKHVAKTRKMVLAAVMANPKFTDEPMPGSGEERKRERNWWRRFLDIYYGSANMSRRTQDMEGGKKGIIWNLLVGMKREAQDAENRMILKRMQPIQDFIKANHINTSDFYEEFSIDLGEGRTASYRYTDLVYMYLSQNSRRNREAVAYGKLVTQLEKDAIREEVLNEIPGEGWKKDRERTKESNKRIRELGDQRYENVIRQAEGIIRDPSRDVLFSLVRLIEKDFNSDLFERLREAQQRIYNVVVTKEDYYLPLNRTDYAGSSPAETVKQDLLNMIPGNGSVQRGFLDDRNDFSPYRQSNINTDFFGIWQNSVYAQEHALANMEYVRLLKGVFINNGSQAVRSAITNTFGSATMESIENHISLIANPRSFQKMNKDADRIFRFLKGSLYSSYLGLRPRSIITQLITSWAPMWGAVNPIELARGYMAFTTHPIEVWAEICRLSPFMATRSMNPTLEWIKEEASKAELPKWRRGIAKFNEKGMKGLEWADRFSVGAGWWAIFQRERSRLLTEGNLRTDEEIDQAAAKIADDFVQETQPVSDITELSPLFQNRNEALKILTQFTASLNVVWQNVTRDIPNAVRNKQYAKAIGMSMGYFVSGIILYAVQQGFKGDDDDDENSGWDKFRDVLYFGTTQLTAGVPIISDYVDSIVEKFITGETEGVFNTATLPAVDRVYRTINEISDGEWAKAAEHMLDSLMLFTGLPYSFKNDVKKAISWDDNGNVEYHPEVFIGRDPD